MMNKLFKKVILPFSPIGNINKQITQKCLYNTSISVNKIAFNNNPRLYRSCFVFYNNTFVRSKTTSKHSIRGDDQDEDSSLSKDSKVVKFNTSSMRTDLILKSSLGIARNKIEQMFYESKIRNNGKKVMKKSASIHLGDEIDVVKSISPNNSEHLYISRIEILNVEPNEDSITVTVRRFKNLLIENYDEDPYKATSSTNE